MVDYLHEAASHGLSALADILVVYMYVCVYVSGCMLTACSVFVIWCIMQQGRD